MNETVKQALLAERDDAKQQIESRVQDALHICRRLAHVEGDVQEQRSRLADIELHLKDNGVDLAAVDAEAKKARPTVDQMMARADRIILGQYGLSQSANQFDPTAGLVKALDEA